MFFDYQEIYESWPDAPTFAGKRKQALVVNEWLKAIKEGCRRWNLPRSWWCRVAQHYLRGRAKARFDALKKVMRNMHEGRYTWNWKKFKIAIRNMRCEQTLT